ncbi:hypothetical protein AB3X91_27770 [Paraburkholderia sp. BR14263]|uniref:hypothetical protein n=1 Tax=unclassified Paraburkholderia TaxID=2615204 RepID=UPI0034CEEFC4
MGEALEQKFTARTGLPVPLGRTLASVVTLTLSAIEKAVPARRKRTSALLHSNMVFLLAKENDLRTANR